MYLGNQPALSYTSFAKQDFTTSATTSYTLDQPVANANELALFINFVRQEPTTAYTASGTTLTLTSATSASDDMYCVFLGKAVQTVNPPSGSVGLSQLSATGTKDSTTFLRGDNTFASAGGTNTPTFKAYRATSQNISDNVSTKIQFDTEKFDTDNVYDNSTNYRFTPNVAGKYFIYTQVNCSNSVGDDIYYAITVIKKNGTEEARNTVDPKDSSPMNQSYNYVATELEMNGTTDYVEVFAQINTGTGTPSAGDGSNQTYFGAYKIIE